MKECPFCAKQIQDEAIVCRFCNRNLKEDFLSESYEQLKDINRKLETIKILLFIMLLPAIIFIGMTLYQKFWGS